MVIMLGMVIMVGMLGMVIIIMVGMVIMVVVLSMVVTPGMVFMFVLGGGGMVGAFAFVVAVFDMAGLSMTVPFDTAISIVRRSGRHRLGANPGKDRRSAETNGESDYRG